MKKPCLLGVIVVILDQVTKFLINSYVSCGSSIKIVPFLNFFNITSVTNTGMSFGMFKGKNSLFSVIIPLFLLGLSLLIYKNWDKINKIRQYAFCLVIAGGLGNLIDRLFRGAVVDFLDFGINSLRWPSFNIADSSNCIAMFLIIADVIFLSKKQKV
ncbi:lipoprotein signal peptidase [Endomicrobiia bacterium]|nr:lipoprotein signal peptidase [Endomicrobiia bacterium]